MGKRGGILKIDKIDGRSNISGKVVKQAREQLELSQESLAARLQLAGLNMTQKTISRIETGSRIVADYEIKYLADALNLSVYQLLSIQENE